MSGRKSIYRKLWKRWLIIEAVSAVVFSIIALNGDLGLWFVLWLLFSFVSNAIWGPGVVSGRAILIQQERKKRIAREFNESWERANPEYVSAEKRRLNWIHDVKELATDTYEDEKGERMYVIPGLANPIPLDYLEDLADFNDWKEYVGMYIDWKEFKEEYPWIDSFSDYDKRQRAKQVHRKDYVDSDDDEYYDKYYDRHMRWINEMKRECTYEGNGPGGVDTYSSHFLWRNIPLDDLEIYAGSKTFNYMVSQYIDWENFREYFPGLETWEYDEEDDEDYD